ncbi:MAG: arsenite efflux transporter metallochaperone ArsD [Acidimicrobiales bacterium]|nr:arsenite efflux transporter metallochaperone ArsD [Acidimicrobiales bacterium]
MKIEVFDPAMCCSTGVCGPSVDPALAVFAGDLDWLGEQGVEVDRFNLGQEPGLFVENEQVKALLDVDGEAALPAVFADGELQSSGRFPTRDELASWSGIESSAESAVVSESMIVELAAIGAAIGANCEPCFKYHYAEARKLSLTKDDLALAVRTAQAVKSVPAATVLDTASRLLGVDTAALGGAASADDPAAESSDTGACCGGEPAAGPTADASSGCS